MMRIMFFIMGVPMMILSFFEAIDVMPYVAQSAVIIDGNEVVLTQEQQQSLEEQISEMLQSAHTLPAFGVINSDEFESYVQQGKFVSLKFQRPLELNGLPFDELVFEVAPDIQAFNLFRGNRGVFQGRCIYIDLMGGSMENLSNLIDSFELVENAPTTEEPSEEEAENPVEEQPQEPEQEISDAPSDESVEESEGGTSETLAQHI